MLQTPGDDVTYYELFEHYIQSYEKENVNINFDQEVHIGRSYSLYEDLKLINALSSIPDVQNKDFKQLEKSQIVQRSYQSIRDRFRNFLTKLKQSDLEKIVTHLKQNGIEGYLLFSSSTNKELLGISLKDPKFAAVQQERKRLTGESPQPQKKMSINKKDTVEESFGMIETTQEKKKKPAKMFHKDIKDKFKVDELDIMLSLIAEWKKVPKEFLIDKLHQVSANLVDFDEYMRTKDEKVCWFEDDDQLLAQGDQAKHDQSVEIKHLVRLKGLDRVRRRVKYLGIKLPFHLE